jgi:hypothetical protein
MARKHSFRFGLSIVFAGRRSVGGVGLGCQPIRFDAAARFGAPGSGWPDSVLSDSKSPRRIFRRGLISCDDEDMPVICPTCQNVFAGSLKRPDHVTLHGVVFDIFVESSQGAGAQRMTPPCQRWLDDASPIHPN